METAIYDPQGGPLFAAASLQHPQMAVYRLNLLAPDGTRLATFGKGDFVDPTDDAWPLPSRPSYHGLVVHLLGRIAIIPGHNAYGLGLAVNQGNQRLAFDSKQDVGQPPSVRADVFIRLIRGGA